MPRGQSGAVVKYGKIELYGDTDIDNLVTKLDYILDKFGYPEEPEKLDLDKLDEDDDVEEEDVEKVEEDIPEDEEEKTPPPWVRNGRKNGKQVE